MYTLLFLLVSLGQMQYNPDRPAVAPVESFVKGSIEEVNGHRIVNLWGSHYDMGFAHGYLLGDEIMDLVEQYGLGVITSPSLYQNYLLPMVTYAFALNEDYNDELTGMLAGMRAGNADLYIDLLD
ncbi:MAG: hypothetical protein ABIK28_25300, partial [Planctomycetota bacterium]